VPDDRLVNLSLDATEDSREVSYVRFLGDINRFDFAHR
jgi:hypothetical protein